MIKILALILFVASRCYSVATAVQRPVLGAVVVRFHGTVFPAGTAGQVRVLQHDGRVDRLHRGRTSGTAHPVADGRRDTGAGRPVPTAGHVQRHVGLAPVPAGHVQAGRAQRRVPMPGHQRRGSHRQPGRSCQGRYVDRIYFIML